MSPAVLAIRAVAIPPRDRTSRASKAVSQCVAAWDEAHSHAKDKGQTTAAALRAATVAYKLAMPKLDNLPAIRAAIACIAHGISLEVFTGRDASQLLYAAQVALSIHQRKAVKK
jgi:hypothetical protein